MVYCRDEGLVKPRFIFVGDKRKLFYGKGKMGYASFWGTIRSIVEGFDIPIIEFNWHNDLKKDEADMCFYLKGVNNWIDSEKEFIEPIPLRKKARPMHIQIEDVLGSIRGIGRKNVRLLFDSGNWGDLGEMLSEVINKEPSFRLKVLGRKAKKRQDITALPGIKGFGEKRVDAIVDLLKEEYVRK
ncbi:MAG: hypothetical protein V3U02_12245 [Calditrichia bacterium]